MDLIYLIALVAALGVLAYLVVAISFPYEERF